MATQTIILGEVPNMNDIQTKLMVNVQTGGEFLFIVHMLKLE